MLIPHSRKEVIATLANTISLKDRRSKMLYILKHVLGIDTQCFQIILRLPSADIKIKIDELDESLKPLNTDFIPLDNEKILIEIGSYAGLLKELFNRIFYSPDFDKNFKKLFFLKTVNLALSLSKLGTDTNPSLYAFISNIFFITSKLSAAFDHRNRPVTLREQDRLKWDKRLITKGLGYLDKSASGNHISIYHLQAGVAACHCLAKNYQSTNWVKILSLYDQYLTIHKSAHVELERAVVISRLKNPGLGLELAEGIKNNKQLEGYPYLYSTIGNFHLQLHNYRQALNNYKTAYELSDTGIDRSFYSKKIRICSKRIRMIEKYNLNKSF